MTQLLLQEPIYQPDWPVSAAMGRKIIKRHFDFCGYSYEIAGHVHWHPEGVGDDWCRAFFSFSWLQEVVAVGNNHVAAAFIREFVHHFTQLSKHDAIHPSAGELEVVGERLSHWLYYRALIIEGSQDVAVKRYQRSLMRYVRQLYEVASLEPESLGPSAIKGLIVAACTIPSLAFMLHEVLGWLDELMARDIQEDGSHISHSPNHHFAFLKTLIEMRDALAHTYVAYDPLNDTITRMGAILQMFTHGDGRLALFHDNIMEEADMLAQVIDAARATYEGETDASESALAPVTYAEHAGYGCFRAGASCLFIRMIPAHSTTPPLGVSSLEFSEGAERIFVNCGSYIGQSEQWQQAMQQTSAFSTVTLDGHRQPVRHGYIAQSVEEKPDHHHASLQYMLHDYIRHERRLSLTMDGRRLTGHDTVTLVNPPPSYQVPSLVARFHLHPDMRCQPYDEGGYVLKSLSGVQWRFSCDGAQEMAIEESVYLGYYGKPQKTLQLVMRLPLDDSHSSLSWSLEKVV
ncbi:MAG: hypothetical protein F6K62_10450 [Sphaerospermopsis sp. SIO1G2]|nr:hypothetical protein [Sphaerospermopsis sp. SIO1G2]